MTFKMITNVAYFQNVVKCFTHSRIEREMLYKLY
jgi:hypothetical protein